MGVHKADPSKLRPNRRQQAKTIAEFDHIKCTWDGYLGEFRVTLDGLSKDREEAVAYYTDFYDDALGTAKCMSEFRVKELEASRGADGKVRGKGDTIWAN